MEIWDKRWFKTRILRRIKFSFKRPKFKVGEWVRIPNRTLPITDKVIIIDTIIQIKKYAGGLFAYTMLNTKIRYWEDEILKYKKEIIK